MSSNLPNLLIAAALGLAVGWVAARGIPAGSEARMAALEAGQQQILRELQALRGGAPAAPAAEVAPSAQTSPLLALPKEPLAIANAASLGRADAPITLLEFSDFQCPFCARHVRETFDRIKQAYVDTGKVRYVFRHYPIESLHPQAWAAARTAECAGRQGKFWELHRQLFANQKQLSDADLQRYASNAGVDLGGLQQCVTDASVTAKITQDLEDGARAGVAGTPMFFAGVVENGKLKTLKRVNGAASFEQFQQALDSLLNQ